MDSVTSSTAPNSNLGSTASSSSSTSALQTPQKFSYNTDAGYTTSGGETSDGGITEAEDTNSSDSDTDAGTPRIKKKSMFSSKNKKSSSNSPSSASKNNSTTALSPRSPGPIGRQKSMKITKKVDAFKFEPSGQGYNPHDSNPWSTHDPNTRLEIDFKKIKPVYCIGMGGALKSIRNAVSKKKKRFTEGDFDLDLSYITPRIIAMGFPSVGREGLYRNPMLEVQRFFETRHAGRYRIYNLCSERAYDPAEFLCRVARYPFDDHNPCPLHLIAAFCEDMDSWLNQHPENVVAIHCKAGKGRTGLMISAYLVHCGFKPNSEAALRWFGMKRTANAKGVTIPSQMRYVHYYESILRNGFPVTYCYQVTHIRLRGVPAVEMSGNCAPWFQLFIDGVKIFDYKKAVGTKNLYKFKKNEPYMDLNLTNFDVRIANNVKIQFLHEGVTGAVKLCHLWFHTGYITRNYLVFGKNVIDKACKDKKGMFPPNFAIEFYLHRTDTPPLTPGEQEIAAANAKAKAAALEAEMRSLAMNNPNRSNNNSNSRLTITSPRSNNNSNAPSGTETDSYMTDGGNSGGEKKKRNSLSSGISMRLLSPKAGKE